MGALTGYILGFVIGLIGLVVAVHTIAEDAGGCLAYFVAITCAITMALNATMMVAHVNKAETTTDVTTEVTTVAPQYTATVKNADGSETKYDIKSYETKEGTMELTLKDGTKVFVPVVNITIAEQTTAVETTTETK